MGVSVECLSLCPGGRCVGMGEGGAWFRGLVGLVPWVIGEF